MILIFHEIMAILLNPVSEIPLRSRRDTEKSENKLGLQMEMVKVFLKLLGQSHHIS